jgi:hypothetical protein
LEDNVKAETPRVGPQGGAWNLKRVLVAGIVLVSLTACQFVTPALLPPAPTCTATLLPTPTCTATPLPTPTYTATSSPIPTPAPTDTPVPSPTSAPVLPPDGTLTRGPYLQSVTTSTVIVVWETDLPGQGEVVYGGTEAYGSSAADPAVGTRHAVTLTGLAPYTFYHYRVGSGGVPLSEDATFRTAAGPDQTEFAFAAFGDTRMQHPFHRMVVERIVAAEPDFALHTGDLVTYGHEADEWKTFLEIERALMARVPLFPALGNHEGNDPQYFDLFYLPGNERWYAFDYGNARFVCLQVDGFADFGPGSEQHGWLEQTLAANAQPWLFVYFHIPPYSSVWDELEDDVRRALPPLFERYGVDMVFNGHKHNYERNEVNGITYVVTAGGGAPLYAMQEREPTQAAFVMAHHFVLLEVDDRHLKATVISSEGEVLDEFERNAD